MKMKNKKGMVENAMLKLALMVFLLLVGFTIVARNINDPGEQLREFVENPCENLLGAIIENSSCVLSKSDCREEYDQIASWIGGCEPYDDKETYCCLHGVFKN